MRNTKMTQRHVFTAVAALTLASLCARARAEFVDTLVDTGVANTNATNLQASIDSALARAGETRIVLPAGATFARTTGVTITLKKKTIDNAYCTIESSALSALGAGIRVSPASAASMPKVLTPGGNSLAVQTVDGAHHYRLRGLEISSVSATSFTALVMFGNDVQNTVAQVPHHIELDRCYVHAFDDTQSLTRGVAMHSANTIVTNCYISGFKNAGADAQAIGGYNGMGPFMIINNYLEGSGENYLMGGASALIPNVIPTDVTFKRNYCFKPIAWRTTSWVVKNLFEIKFGKRYDVEGNIFENTWAGGQDFAIAIKVDSNNQSSNTDAKMRTEDIYFTNNIVRHAPGAILLQGRDWSAGRAPAMQRVTLRNNVCEDINRHTWGAVTSAAGSFLYPNNGPTQVTADHNTCFNERYLIAFDVNAYPQTNFVYTNNITQGQAYPWNPIAHVYGGNTGLLGTAALNAFVPSGYSFTKNIIEGTFSNSAFTGTDSTSNWWPTAWTGVLVNQPSGDYHVVTGTPYKNGGTDGKDVGADVDQVAMYTANATTGNWAGKDIVLRASEATVKVGAWAVASDSAASDGQCLKETDAGLAKVSDPLANPASYFEMTFQAQANVPYHLWIRGKAPNTTSDSVHVQFTNTIDSVGNPVYRIGTGGSAAANIYSIEWVLENGSGAGESGWGWRDSKWGTTTSEKRVIFATTGTQTIRIQRREDGPMIDEIMLSPAAFMGEGPLVVTAGEANYNPGTEKDDTTILAKTPTGNGDAVVYPSKAATKVDWASTADATAAGGNYIGQSHSTQAKITTALAAPTSYFETTFQAQAGVPYHIWVRGRALNDDFNNDSVYLQFDHSVDSGGVAKWRSGTTDATVVILEEGSGAGELGWGWNDNNYGAISTDYVYFSQSGTQAIRVQQREDGYQLDQIVISPATYLTTSPGALKSDTTILPEQ